ncbi:FlaA1/EpsC-like NDP-sugar epimerase [Evansella vedderi]|uniref:FlaA1/EpsC-like NDP-sugar epimerase n=2 Tax=Evansella vedderi TaxID=38282 RepID=A0ABT9ZX76_9BACI|nr:FlaA1/EpsC-like NDP-sugar epimerase [Evansella vedderi]
MSLRKRALIIGAGEAGSMVVKQLIQSNEAEFYPIGFVDDDHKKQKLEVSGFPVLGRRTDIPNIVKKYDISTIIVAIPSAPKSQIKEIVHICKQTKAHIQILPRLQDLIHGRISVKEIRGVDVKDLLGRDMVKHRIDQLNNYLQDRVVLVTGAGGSIGSELAYQVAQCDPKMVLLLGHGENSIQKTETKLNESMPRVTTVSLIVDIQDQMLIDDVFNRFRPEVVFHAAAHKHVPLMEKNEVAAIKNNVFGTKIVAEAADRYEVKRFVFISTDKAVNPVNIMGMTKRLGELLIQQLAAKSSTKFSIVRFGNVLESRGSVVPIFKRQIAMGGPVTVTHPDMVRYFMTIPEAVQLVLEAGSLSSGGEIFVLNMGEPVKIVDLAKTLIRLSGYEPDYDIKIEYTGIRPGEKLSESLFYNDERSIPSKHPDISIASTMSINYTQFQRELKKLEVSLKNSSDDFRNTLLRIIQNVSSTRV